MVIHCQADCLVLEGWWCWWSVLKWLVPGRWLIAPLATPSSLNKRQALTWWIIIIWEEGDGEWGHYGLTGRQIKNYKLPKKLSYCAQNCGILHSKLELIICLSEMENYICCLCQNLFRLPNPMNTSDLSIPLATSCLHQRQLKPWLYFQDDEEKSKSKSKSRWFCYCREAFLAMCAVSSYPGQLSPSESSQQNSIDFFFDLPSSVFIVKLNWF